MYCDKKTTLFLLLCLIITSILVLCYWIYNNFFNKLNIPENFNTKRNIKMKIYKSDDILDPDENPENDDEGDPDNKPMQFDPDQNPN